MKTRSEKRKMSEESVERLQRVLPIMASLGHVDVFDWGRIAQTCKGISAVLKTNDSDKSCIWAVIYDQQKHFLPELEPDILAKIGYGRFVQKFGRLQRQPSPHPPVTELPPLPDPKISVVDLVLYYVLSFTPDGGPEKRVVKGSVRGEELLSLQARGGLGITISPHVRLSGGDLLVLKGYDEDDDDRDTHRLVGLSDTDLMRMNMELTWSLLRLSDMKMCTLSAKNEDPRWVITFWPSVQPIDRSMDTRTVERIDQLDFRPTIISGKRGGRVDFFPREDRGLSFQPPRSPGDWQIRARFPYDLHTVPQVCLRVDREKRITVHGLCIVFFKRRSSTADLDPFEDETQMPNNGVTLAHLLSELHGI